MTAHWMQTFTGRRFYPTAPRIEDVCIEDIAHHLSMICRFGGSVRIFYSVAEHAVRVARWVEGIEPVSAFDALNHDDSEAYLGDIIWPLKRSAAMAKYRRLERKLEALLVPALGLSPVRSPAVKQGDLVLLATEKRDLVNGLHKSVLREASMAHADLGGLRASDIEPLVEKIRPWSQRKAEGTFLAEYRRMKALRDRLHKARGRAA